MNIFLTDDSSIGPIKTQLAKAELKLAAEQLQWKIVDDAKEADLIIILGNQIISNAEFIGHKISLMHIDNVFVDTVNALKQAQNNATLYDQHQAVNTSTALPKHESKRIVAVTACPTGVAHTYMAAEAIEEEARKRGWECKVETRGSVGVGNELTPEEIESADLVFVAVDIEVDLSKFAGKLMYRTKTGPALKKTAQEFDKAVAEAQIYQPNTNNSASVKTDSSNDKKGVYQHLLTGISYMLPMVVAGGLIIALSFAVGGINQQGSLAKALGSIGGGAAFALMVPLLSGYIAYSIADRPGLVPGLIGGMLANSIGAGFLGGIISGYLAGYLVYLLAKYIRLPQSLSALKPILILPFISSLITGLAIIYIIGEPIAYLMKWLESWLSTMQTSNAVILGAILGGMMCVDMGGPINKVAYAFGVGLLSSQQYAPMAAIMAGGMVPPLAMSLATILAKHKFSDSERGSGKVAFVLGLCFISEGAIPFAARDPLRVLSSSMIGGAVTGGLTMLFGSKLMAPHGGLFVLAIPGAITPVVGYLISIAVGTVVAGVLYAFLKRPEDAQELAQSE
jgi:fructose PTS system EIIBC or EIIC component